MLQVVRILPSFSILSVLKSCCAGYKVVVSPVFLYSVVAYLVEFSSAYFRDLVGGLRDLEGPRPLAFSRK